MHIISDVCFSRDANTNVLPMAKFGRMEGNSNADRFLADTYLVLALTPAALPKLVPFCVPAGFCQVFVDL